MAISSVDGRFKNFKFDSNRNLIEKVTEKPSEYYKAKYDEKNRLLYEEEVGKWKKFTYDKYSNVVCREFSNGQVVRHEYDTKNREINRWVNNEQVLKNYR